MLSRVFYTLLALAICGSSNSYASAEKFLGQWELTAPSHGASWLEVVEHDGWFDASILWLHGSVVPASSVTIEEDKLTLVRTRAVDRNGPGGELLRQQLEIETFTGVITAGGVLHLTRSVANKTGTGFEFIEATGVRTPPLPPPPNLDRVRFGEPIELINGKDLSGWRPTTFHRRNGWRVENGLLMNDPRKLKPGEAEKGWTNLQTEAEFSDFELTLEVMVPEGGNSGVYLRGMYEVQVFDSYGLDTDTHHMGAIYSRIRPAVAAEKPAGQWQSLDMTLVDRHVTVVLNGVKIIDNEPIAGCTGGAMWSDVSRPGPIFLQGDHGPIQFRNMVIRPVAGR